MQIIKKGRRIFGKNLHILEPSQLLLKVLDIVDPDLIESYIRSIVYSNPEEEETPLRTALERILQWIGMAPVLQIEHIDEWAIIFMKILAECKYLSLLTDVTLKKIDVVRLKYLRLDTVHGLRQIYIFFCLNLQNYSTVIDFEIK